MFYVQLVCWIDSIRFDAMSIAATAFFVFCIITNYGDPVAWVLFLLHVCVVALLKCLDHRRTNQDVLRVCCSIDAADRMGLFAGGRDLSFLGRDLVFLGLDLVFLGLDLVFLRLCRKLNSLPNSSGKCVR